MEGVCFTPILEEKLSQVRNFKMKMLLTTPEAKQARETAFAENRARHAVDKDARRHLAP